MKIVEFEEKYRDDMIFMVLQAKDALGCVPTLREDLLDIPGNYPTRGDMFWLALDDNNRVIGCIGTKTEKELLWLKRLYVKASMKRQGIGSALLALAEDFARGRGIREIRVHLGGKEYFESRRFYPKHGYEEFVPRFMRKFI